MTSAITSAINVEASFRCVYDPNLATSATTYYPWLTPYSTPNSSQAISYVPQLQNPTPLHYPHVGFPSLQAASFPPSMPIVTPAQLPPTSSPLFLPPPQRTSSGVPHLAPSPTPTPIPQTSTPIITHLESSSSTSSHVHQKGGLDYESSASSIGDLKDMMTNYMNQLNENVKAVTLDVNFFEAPTKLVVG